MSSCGNFHGTVVRTPVISGDRRTNERMDDKEVTPIQKNRACVDQKLDKVLDHLNSQKEENYKLKRGLK